MSFVSKNKSSWLWRYSWQPRLRLPCFCCNGRCKHRNVSLFLSFAPWPADSPDMFRHLFFGGGGGGGGGHWLGNSTIKKGCIHTPFSNWGIWSPHLHAHMHCSSPLGYQHSPFTRKPNKKTITSNNTSSKSRQKDNTTKTCLHRCWERGRDHRPGTWRCRCTLCKGRVRCMVLHLLYLCTLPVLLGLDLDNAYLIPGDLAYYKRVAQPYPAVG